MEYNINYDFWEMAYNSRAINIDLLRQAVITSKNPFGDINEAEFKTITGIDFIVKPAEPVQPPEPVQPANPSETAGATQPVA